MTNDLGEKHGGRRMLLGAASGLMLYLSFPPASVYLLAWVAALPLLWLAAQDPRKALLPGYAAGATFFILGLAWVRCATYAGWIVLALFLGLYVMAFAVVSGFLRRRTHLPLAIIAPAVWVTLEAVRSNVMSGFPYLLLGHSQIDDVRLMQVIDVTGVYGVSFIVMAANGLLAEVLLATVTRRLAATVASALVVAAALVVAFSYGQHRLATLQTRTGPEVCIVQANIPQEIKNSMSRRETYDFFTSVLVKHIKLTRDCLNESEYINTPNSPQPLVIWPETAVPGPFNDISSLWTLELRSNIDIAVLKDFNVNSLLLGVTSMDVVDGKKFAFNSAVHVRGRCDNSQRYDKMHLVPFGEYIPLPWLLFPLRPLVPIELPFSEGNEYTIFEHEGEKFAVVICYEDVFPGLVRHFVGRGADFIVNISNEGWFFTTAEADQHLAIARCRAIENRIGLVRATNSGISCLIDPAGRVEKVIQQDGQTKLVQGWLSGHVTLGSRDAAYTRIGDAFALGCIGLTVLLAAAAGMLSMRKPR